MSITRRVGSAVPDIHTLAVTALPAGKHHRSAANGHDRRASRRGVIGSMMRSVQAKDRMEPVAIKSRRNAECALSKRRPQKRPSDRLALVIVVFGSLARL